MERSFFVINDIHLIHKQAIYIKKDFVFWLIFLMTVHIFQKP